AARAARRRARLGALRRRRRGALPAAPRCPRRRRAAAGPCATIRDLGGAPRGSPMKSFFQRVRKPAPADAAPLTRDGLLASDLWVDQPDAPKRIDGWQKRGEVDDGEAAALRSFVERGYLVFDAGLPAAIFDELAADVDRAWRDKPADLAYSPGGLLRSFAYADSARDRRPSYRIADLYSHSAAALQIYLWPAIFRYVERLLGQQAVATQSL